MNEKENVEDSKPNPADLSFVLSLAVVLNTDQIRRLVNQLRVELDRRNEPRK